MCRKPEKNNPGVWLNVPGKCRISGVSVGCTHIICSGHLPTKFFVSILQMLGKLYIVPGHLPRHQDCFSQVFHIFPRTITQTPGLLFFFRFSTHPWDMYCIFTCVWHIYLRHLPIKLFVYILQLLQKFCIFSETITYRVVFFLGFPHISGHILHFYMCVAYVFRTFTH